MRQFKTLAFVLALGVPVVAACDNPLDLDINEDPNAATDVPGDNLMPFVQATLAANRVIEFGPGNTTFSQIWASNGSTGVFSSPERYTISSFTTGNSWAQLYNDVLKNLLLMRDQALEAEPQRVNVAAQAELLSAYTFWALTALWGEVPYTEALNANEFPNPNFDEQEVILRGLVDQIDAALGLIDPNGGPAVEFGDLIYSGDMSRWERFGNSLKLRILMMIRNRDPSVDSEIAAVLGEPLIRDNADEAAFPFFSASENENNYWKVCSLFSALEGDGCFWHGASATLVAEMKEYGDPRLTTYFTPSPLPDTTVTEIVGQVPGRFQFGDETALLSQNIVREDWPSRMITAAEVWLLEAEFRASQGDLPGAHASYLEGISRGLDFFDGKPGSIDQADKDAYLAAVPQSFVAQNSALREIWRQQYIEVFDRAPENWTQWRRTYYPDLPLPEQATLGDIIRRFPIPPDEQSSNPNAPSQVTLTEPMWFEPQN